MLKGKILQISYRDGRFFVKVDRLKKVFNTIVEMDNYLIYILKKVKDPYKTKLLKQDIANYLKKN